MPLLFEISGMGSGRCAQGRGPRNGIRIKLQREKIGSREDEDEKRKNQEDARSETEGEKQENINIRL